MTATTSGTVNPGERVTSADVARAAGVSRATVSYVLNGATNQTITAETRQRVLDAVDQLGYIPSAAARTLRRGRSDVVLFARPEGPVGPSVTRLIEALAGALSAHGLTLLTHEQSSSSRPSVEVWHTLSPAAIVTLYGFGAPEQAAIARARIPAAIALVDGADANRREVLNIPNHAAGRLQVEHLHERGHRRVVHLLPLDQRLADSVVGRSDGVRLAGMRLGLGAPPTQRVPAEPGAAATILEALVADGVTAVCAYNDDLAFSVLAAARLLDLRVPDDLAVVGVDDIPLARYASPPLTTVAWDLDLVARSIAETIVARLSGRATTRPLSTDVARLVVRESS